MSKSSKKITPKIQKAYYCSEDHKLRIQEASEFLGVSDSDLIVIAVENFLKKSYPDQLEDFAAAWAARAAELRAENNEKK